MGDAVLQEVAEVVSGDISEVEDGRNGRSVVHPRQAKRRRLSNKTRSREMFSRADEDRKWGSSAEGLDQLSNSCIFGILSRLSPEDLCSLAQTNRYFRNATEEPSIWKALYYRRWTQGPSAEEEPRGSSQTRSWKASYMKRDAADMEVGLHVPEPLQIMFRQMNAARRSEPLPSHIIDTLMQRSRELSLLDKVVEIRKRQGKASSSPLVNLQDNRPLGTICSSASDNGLCSEGCQLIEIENNVWFCERGWHVHACGDACTERVEDSTTNMLVCRVTGRCFQSLIGECEVEEPGVKDDDTNDWNLAEEGMGGRLGRAFFAGYNAVDEREMLYRFGVQL